MLPAAAARNAHLRPPSLQRVTRVELVRRTVREVLSPLGVELLLARAQVLFEGDVGPDRRGDLSATHPAPPAWVAGAGRTSRGPLHALEAPREPSAAVRAGSGPDAPEHAFLSVMLTVDLHAAASDFSDPMDEVTVERIAELAGTSRPIRAHVRTLAARELARRLARGISVRDVNVEIRARSEKLHLLIDGDVVVSMPSRRAGARAR